MCVVAGRSQKVVVRQNLVVKILVEARNHRHYPDVHHGPHRTLRGGPQDHRCQMPGLLRLTCTDRRECLLDLAILPDSATIFLDLSDQDSELRC